MLVKFPKPVSQMTTREVGLLVNRLKQIIRQNWLRIIGKRHITWLKHLYIWNIGTY